MSFQNARVLEMYCLRSIGGYLWEEMQQPWSKIKNLLVVLHVLKYKEMFVGTSI